MAAFSPVSLLPLAGLMAGAVSSASASARSDDALATREAEAALAEQSRAAALAAEEAATADDLARAHVDRQTTLTRTTASERARQAAAGISGGTTARVLLEGLAEEADRDRRDAEAAASRRLETIRRQTEEARRKDLLDLAATRRRTALTRQASVGRSVGGLADVLYGAAGQLARRW